MCRLGQILSALRDDQGKGLLFLFVFCPLWHCRQPGAGAGRQRLAGALAASSLRVADRFRRQASLECSSQRGRLFRCCTAIAQAASFGWGGVRPSSLGGSAPALGWLARCHHIGMQPWLSDRLAQGHAEIGLLDALLDQIGELQGARGLQAIDGRDLLAADALQKML